MYSKTLKELRSNKNLKADEVASYLGMNRYSYTNFENEKDILPFKHLIKLCEYFDVSIDYIFGFVYERNYDSNKYAIDKKLFGERLRKMRLSLYLNQSHLADILGCSRFHISNYENGLTTISTFDLYILCSKFNISADYLLGKTNEPKTINISENDVDWKVEDSVYMYRNRLRYLRKKANLKREDLANIVGIHVTKYCQYEKESYVFPLKHINTICNYFDISIDYFLGLSDKEKYENYKEEINLEIQGKNLKILRKKLGLTMEKFAKDLNSNESTLRNYELGKILISTKILYKICKKYEVSADFILGKMEKSSK